MEISPEHIAKSNAIREELQKDILDKLNLIKDKILTHEYKTIGEEIQTLTMVHDDLEDVCLNWEVENLSAIPKFGGDDFYDED